jgi:hypothetical protein
MYRDITIEQARNGITIIIDPGGDWQDERWVFENVDPAMDFIREFLEDPMSAMHKHLPTRKKVGSPIGF